MNFDRFRYSKSSFKNRKIPETWQNVHLPIFYLIKIVKALKVKFQSALEYVGEPLSRLTKKNTGQSESLKSIISVVATYEPMSTQRGKFSRDFGHLRIKKVLKYRNGSKIIMLGGSKNFSKRFFFKTKLRILRWAVHRLGHEFKSDCWPTLEKIKNWNFAKLLYHKK